jgi:hypothetical protein
MTKGRETMNCPKCGSPNAEGATLCRECGAPLPVQQPRQSAAYEPRATQAYAPPARATSNTALASLICGILGWSLLPLIGSVLAIVLGHMAKNEIKASGGTLGGDGLATIGLILGYGSIALALLGAIIGTILALFFGLALPFGLLGCGLCSSLG